MKKLLTTTMVLGAVFMLETNQPAEALNAQAVVSGTQQTLVTPARFYSGWGVGAPYWGNPYWGDPYDSYYYDYGPVSPGISLFFSF
ncbi:MAG: hypothetical protein HYX35_02450 [Proteobacteria bacterium]|nr:hypothetical protein [Pseudomonadota bacterium]